MTTQSVSPEDFANPPLGTAIEVADGIFAVNAAFWGFPNTVYAIRSGARWALIDSGIAETPSQAIEPFLESRGGYASLELVLGTHGHLDHIGGNAAIRSAAPHVRFGLGALDAGWAEDPDLHYSELYEHGAPEGWRPDGETEQVIRSGIGGGVPIDHALTGGEVLTFGDDREIEAVHLGAHSPGQMLYIDRLTGVVFSGDAVQGAGVLSAASGLRDFPMYRTRQAYLDSLETIRRLAPGTLATAHVGIRSATEVGPFLDSAIAWGERFDDLLLELLTTGGPQSIEALVPSIGAHLPEYALGLQVRVTTGQHLEDLATRGLVVRDVRANPPLWRAADPTVDTPSPIPSPHS